MNGYEYEEKCGEYLLTQGYTSIEVTRKAGDFGVDIIAYKNNIKYGIQCKYYDKPVGNKAIQEVYAGSIYYHCEKSMVITNATFTKQAKELASELGVKLLEGIDATVLIHSLPTSMNDKVNKKIEETNKYIDTTTREFQNFLDKQSTMQPLNSSWMDPAIIYSNIGNQCIRLMEEIDKKLEEIKDNPCPKTAVKGLIDLLKKVETTYLKLRNNPRYGDFIPYRYTIDGISNKWEHFYDSIPYLNEEK